MLIDPHVDHKGLLECISYARCSTEPQIGQSESRQHDINQKYADFRNWGTAIQVEDLAVSGRTSTRSGLDYVWAYCAKFPLTPVLVEDLSRLVRGHVAFAHALMKIAEVMAVIYETKSRRFLSHGEVIRAAGQAIEEYNTLLQHQQDGHDLAGRSGKLVYKAPVGILKDKKGRPYADPEWFVIINEIFGRMATNERITDIANDLNARRIPSPGASKVWSLNHLYNLVANPLYRGVMMHRRKTHHFDTHVVKAMAAARRAEIANG